MTRGAVNREKERERSSYLGGEGGGLVVRQENSLLVGEKLLEWMKLEKLELLKSLPVLCLASI